MALLVEPARAIFPVIVRQPDGLWRRLGTAFFIHLDGTFMTARHVLDVRLYGGETIAAMMGEGPMFDVRDVSLCRDLDIAIARVSPPDGLIALPLSSADPPGNANVVTFEYSNVVGQMVFPATRKGNVVATYPWRSRRSALQEALFLELSFPSPQGSSGAPVIAERDGTVAGMIVDHVDRQLGEYRLPMGMAISSRYLRDFAIAEGLELKLFMIANLEHILKVVDDELNGALLLAARERAGIARSARVASLVPQEMEAEIREPEAVGYPHRVTFALAVRAEVEGWGGPAGLEGSWFGTTQLTSRIRGTAEVNPFQGRFYGRPHITQYEVAVP